MAKSKYVHPKKPCAIRTCEKQCDARVTYCMSHSVMKRHNPDMDDEDIAIRTIWLANPRCPVPGCEKKLNPHSPQGTMCTIHKNVAIHNPEFSLDEIAAYKSDKTLRAEFKAAGGNPEPCPVAGCERYGTYKGPLCNRHAIIRGFHPELSLEELGTFKGTKQITAENVAKAEAILADREARGVKLCTCCEVEKPFGDFHAANILKSGLRSQCKTCDNADSLQRYHKKLKNDSSYKIRKAVSAAVRNALRAVNSSKNGGSCFDYLPFTVEELRVHLESKFTDGMTWDNYGENGWEIDHNIPQAFFNYKSMEDPRFRTCWSLDNLQPLWVKDNQKKNSMHDGQRWRYGDIP